MMKGGEKMTGVQINGNIANVKPSALSATKSAGNQGTIAFADEMKTAVDAALFQEQPVHDEGHKGEDESQWMTDLEKLLNTLQARTEQPERLKENQAEDVYALLQQIYDLMKQANEDGKASMLDMLVRNPKAQSLLMSGEPSDSPQTEEKGMAVLANKIIGEAEALTVKKSEGFPKELLHKLTSILSSLREDGKSQAESSLIVQPRADSMKFVQNASKTQVTGTENDGAALTADVTAKSAVDGETEVASVSLEEGIVTKVMHHQVQASAVLGKEGHAAFTQRNPTMPLIPARFFANEMEGLILKQAQLNRGTGAMETMIRLFPENLGRVDVRIAALDGVITAQFIANSAAGKETIEQQLHQLRQALVQQGLQVEKLEVSYVSSSSSEQPNNHLFDQGKGQSQQQNQEESEEKDASEEGTFDLFKLIEEKQEIDQQA
jgi:flagellar hook-length control protein FliK